MMPRIKNTQGGSRKGNSMTIDPDAPSFGPPDIEAEPLAITPDYDRREHARADAVPLLEVRHRAGIWEVTRDARFYGHYLEGRPALAAAQQAAVAAVESGGAADVVWLEARAQRTMEFRAGAAPVLR